MWFSESECNNDFKLEVTIEKIEDDGELFLSIDENTTLDEQTADWLCEEFDQINTLINDYEEIMELELFEKYKATFIYSSCKSWTDCGYEYDSTSYFDKIRKVN